MLRDWALILLSLAFGIAIGYFAMPNKTVTNSETVIERDTTFVTDTLVIDNSVIPEPVTIVDTFWKTKLIKVDTLAILQAYFNKNAYSDTLVNDSALLVVVNDTISRNQIKSRIPFIVRHYPVITNTKTIYATKDEWFIGGYFGQSFGAELTYRHHKNLYGVGGGSNGIYLKYSRKIK